MLVPIRDLKGLNECYFKRSEFAKRIYKINYYDRSYRKYNVSPVDDMNSNLWIKPYKPVFIGFEY